MSRPALLGLRSHFEGGGDAVAAEPLVRRFVWAHRFEQVLRVSILVLMVLPIG